MFGNLKFQLGLSTFVALTLLARTTIMTIIFVVLILMLSIIMDYIAIIKAREGVSKDVKPMVENTNLKINDYGI
mgnify:CR=1 FL=1